MPAEVAEVARVTLEAMEESVFKEKDLTIDGCKVAIQSVFAGTSCYDLMQQSAKVIVFETTILCHMASMPWWNTTPM